jgi:hypothetical protein
MRVLIKSVSPPPSLHFTIRVKVVPAPETPLRSVSPRSKAFHRARPTLTSNAIPFVQAAHYGPLQKVELQANSKLQ